MYTAKELREKTVDELNNVLHDLLKDQFNYRIQKATGQLAQSHLLGEVRRDIARVKTVLTDKAGA